MALRVKHKDSYTPDIREVKDGKAPHINSPFGVYSCVIYYMFSAVGGSEEEFLGCIRGRRHVPGPHAGAMAFSGSR